MKYPKLLALALCTACTAFVAACGGGGDNNSALTPSATNATSFPLATAMANFVNERKSYQVSISGTASASGQNFPFTGIGTFSESTIAATFEGMPALEKSMTSTGTLDMVGTQVPVADTTATFFDTNYNPIGNTGANIYCVVTSTTPIPTAARVGDNGNWSTSTCYTSSTKLTRLGTVTASYALEPEGDATALLKLVSRQIDTAGNSTSTSITFRVTTSGTLVRVEESGILTINGVTLNLVLRYR